MFHGSIRKTVFNFLHRPNFCHNIDYVKYPWGWKSNLEIKKIMDFPINSLDKNIDHLNDNHELRYVHEYKVRNYAEELYTNTYYSFLEDYDFLNTTSLCPKLSVGLNYIRSNTDINHLRENIKIKDVTLLNSWIKYGSIRNINKFLGFYNDKEIIHQISTGMIGPEIQSVWDQQSIKQKIRFIVKSTITDNRVDIIDLERDMMITESEWQLCNINRIIIN